jgi:polysaccharide biosynthesis transport protein
MKGGDLRERDPAVQHAQDGELDFRAVGRALWRRKFWILVPALVVAGLTIVAVSLMSPRYKSEARVLYEGRENVFLRPEAERSGERDRGVDAETVTSQVQLVLSRELARQVVKELKLNERPEFDSVLRGIGALRHALTLIGFAKDPLRMSPEERIFDAYYQRLQAYQIDKSRVIAVEFQSSDPELAAHAANVIAEGYIQLQQRAKQDQTKAASDYLAGEIETLRKKVADAESKVEEFRTKSNLFVGGNNSMLSNQQLGELSSLLAGARTQQAEAEAKARLIRNMLRSGRPIEYSDIINSELIRRLNEQRITLRAQLAEQSSTLLGNHPRIKELRAQIADLERQIRGEADRLVRSFENDAKLAGARVEEIGSTLDGLKRQAASNNGNDVQLRALEREAKAQRDLLESYLAKYREASARENIGVGQGDARIISRAVVSNTPYFPKKLPIVLIATFATLFLSAGFIATGEMLASTHRRPDVDRAPAQQAMWVEPNVGLLPAPAANGSEGLDFDTPVSAAIERMRATPDGRSRDIVLGLTPDVQSAATSIVLARALAPGARVVLIDLALASPKLSAISSDPRAPGIAELVRGTASFGAVVTRDRGSRALVVGAGHAQEELSRVLESPRLKIALDAISHTNDHVIIDGGALGDIPAEQLTKLARRVILAVPPGTGAEAMAAVEVLRDAGFAESAILTAPGRTTVESGVETPAAA